MVINWQEVITTVGTTVGGGGVLLAAAAWLTKTLLTNRMARDAEAFRFRLQADADTEVERLKSALQIVAVEHQVRFSKLHEKRAEVIAELYNLMARLLLDGQRFVFTGGRAGASPQEEYAAMEQKTREFLFFLDTHRIYLPNRICILLDDYVDKLRKVIIPVGVYGGIDNPTERTMSEKNTVFMKAWEAFEKDIPDAKRVLETEFRAMLGVTDGTRSND